MTNEEFKESLLGTKVATDGKEIEIQKKLFSLGFAWIVGENDIMCADCPYMFIDDRFRITWTWDYDTFSHDNLKEITADYILNTIIEEDDEMTNEEKTREIVNKELNTPITLANRHQAEFTLEGHCVKVALEMAEWKDNKMFRQLLGIRGRYYKKTKNNDIETLSKINCINEIINELFGEEVKVNNSDNDE